MPGPGCPAEGPELGSPEAPGNGPRGRHRRGRLPRQGKGPAWLAEFGPVPLGGPGPGRSRLDFPDSSPGGEAMGQPMRHLADLDGETWVRREPRRKP